MKRLILISVCVAALFSAVPSSAECAPENPLLIEACSGANGSYESCVHYFGPASSVDFCADSNGDAPFEQFLYVDSAAGLLVQREHQGKAFS